MKSPRNSFVIRILAPTAALTACLAPTLEAQGDRIQSRIDKNQRVVLRGNRHPLAIPQYDQGTVDQSFRLPAMTLYLNPSADQQNALQTLAARQNEPTSSEYHQWLTPEQYADRFGASQGDIDKISAWLQSEGFTVENVARTRTWIQFSGSSQQTKTAFLTEIHRYKSGAELHYANASEPSIPAALANIAGGLRGLNDFRWKPRYSKSRLSPDLTLASGEHQVVPDDLATIYDIAPLYKEGVDGSGQKIVVVGQTRINSSDITAFRSKFGLPAGNLQLVPVPNSPNPGISQDDLPEADLDIEWAGAVARNATVIYVYSSDVFTSLQYAVDQNLAPVISMSYGICEPSDLVDLPILQSLALQAISQGITWLAASGDSGAADCEDLTAAVAQNGLAVDAPASIPEVTAVGGTEFNEQGGLYWNSTSTAYGGSAVSYIPERAWNDTSVTRDLSAGGGGASIYFSRPPWQSGAGVPSDGSRHVPDISLNASAQHDGYYVYTGGHAAYFGGTSVGVPALAGIVALLNQYLVATGIQSQAGLGNINPTLYRLAQNTTGVFHDVIAGGNAVPCASGSPNCANGVVGYSTTLGYDQATGLGSPHAYNLVHQWSTQPALTSVVVPSIDQNPVFQQAADASGNPWRFVFTLTEEAGIGTTLTSFSINGENYDVTATFGSAAIAPGGSLTSKTLGLSELAIPANVVFSFSGADVGGRQWSQQLSVPFQGPHTALTILGMSNAASGEQAFAPGEIVSVYGAQMGTVAQLATAIPLPEFLMGFSATVNGVPAPLYFVSPNQVNLQIPYETQPGAATLSVGNPYENASYKFRVAATAPGIFASDGFASAPFSTVRRGQVSTLFITGEGKVNPTLATGNTPSQSVAAGRLPRPVLAVTVTLGGQPLDVSFVGIPPGLVGVTQINFTVPADAPLGAQQVLVTAGGTASPPVRLNVTP